MTFTDRLVRKLERAELADGLANPLAELAGRLIPSGPVKDGLSGTWLDHPVHPMIVALPIGALVSVSALDLTGGDPDGSARRRLIGLALLAAGPAVAAGASDFSDTDGAERRVGAVHATVNAGALALYAASWLARRKRPEGGKKLALAGGGLLALGGWLGGHLSYALGVGVDTTAFQSGPEEWTGVAHLADLPVDEPSQVDVDGVKLVMVRRAGDHIEVLEDRCTHRGGPLSDGELDGECITCPWHGSTFRMDTGEIVRGPASRPQPSYEARVVDGSVEVRRDDPRALRTNAV